MADLYIKDLKKKIAHYEAIMMKCPQCKTSLPTPEAESTDTSDSHPSGSSRSVQPPATNLPPPVLPGPANRRAPGSTLSSSAHHSKQTHPVSQTEPEASDSQQNPASTPPVTSSNRSRRPTKATVSNVQQPPTEPTHSPRTRSGKSSAADTSGQDATTSQNPITHPPPITRSYADKKKYHAGTVLTSDLQPYKKPTSRRQGDPWIRTANTMLEEVPSGPQWREKIRRIESSIMAAVAMDVSPILQKHVARTTGDERNKLIQLVRNFAERHSEWRLNFQQLVLVCLCNVLSYQGVSRSNIVETMQICITDTSQRNVERYLKGATWANKMMNELFLTDWGYRAVDLVAIWNRTVSTYGSLAEWRDSSQYFLTELTQRKYFEGYQEVPGRKHDTIPWIVKKELGDEVSYERICKALGYSDEYFIRTRNLHSSIPSSPVFNDGEGSDNQGSTSRSDSFHTTRQSTIRASSRRRPPSADQTPSSPSTSAFDPADASLLRKQLHQEDNSDNIAGGVSERGQSVASQRTERRTPDGSTEPMGDADDQGRRKPPYNRQAVTELPVSTSLGESAPTRRSTKRRLPESPTSAMQSSTTTRRRQHKGDDSSREELGSPLQPGSRDLTRRPRGAVPE